MEKSISNKYSYLYIPSLSLYGAGTLGGKTAISASTLRPVFYLKSDVKIISGNGSQTEPFHLSL